MSFVETLKRLTLKDGGKPAAGPRDPRRSAAPIAGGRRAGEESNPYLAARRTWNEHTGSVVASRQTWQVIGILSMLIALASVGGMIAIGSQSKFVPYVVEVDKLGRSQAAGPISASSPVDKRLLHAAVADFIAHARLVTPDVAMQTAAIHRVYASLAPSDPATLKMNEWMNGTEDSSPFKRAAKTMVNIEITSVLQQTGETWQVDWLETTRDRSGALLSQPISMRALVSVYVADTTPQTSDEQLRRNPLGIYVRDFSWSRLL